MSVDKWLSNYLSDGNWPQTTAIFDSLCEVVYARNSTKGAAASQRYRSESREQRQAGILATPYILRRWTERAAD
jgi:hypothetical protein